MQKIKKSIDLTFENFRFLDNFHISEAAGVYESSFSEGSSILLAGDMADTGQTSIQRWQPTQLFPTM